jgi:hypothetical protein
MRPSTNDSVERTERGVSNDDYRPQQHHYHHFPKRKQSTTMILGWLLTRIELL